MEVPVPETSRKRALCVIDVQPRTLSPKAKELIPYMVQLIERMPYDAYIEATYFADQDSMFFKQGNLLRTREQTGRTAPELSGALQRTGKPYLVVEKNTRSFFKAKNAAELHEFLGANAIEELHFIGFDINDCVLASAFDAIDLGYYTYIIEELCHHWDANDSLKRAALTIYRRQNMTNRSANRKPE